jgi:hypothetical protein
VGVEIVREHYDGASVSANINSVCSEVPVGWASRMDVPRWRGWELVKNTVIFETLK